MSLNDYKTYFKQHTLLKITSLNSLVICVRLFVSVFIQNLLAETVGASGLAKVGQIRNLIGIVTSTSSLGVFNGVVKYTSELKEDKTLLNKMFSTTFIFIVVGVICSSLTLLFFSNTIAVYLFGDSEFVFVIKLLAVIVPSIALNRVFSGVLNGLSAYKKYAKIELFSYLLSSLLFVSFLLQFNLDGVLVAIAITPVLQLLVSIFVFGKTLKKYIKLDTLKLNNIYLKGLLVFTIMSLVSTVLLNFVEIDIRTQISNRINEDEAGNWTAMLFLSKNYMVFSSGLFTLYVIPKFARIQAGTAFKKEVIHIYKTLIPLFGIGMIFIYLFRNVITHIIYPDFDAMEPLFKWQLLGDFVKIASLVIAHQFLAKKMLVSFVVTEIISLALFYGLSIFLVGIYGTEGVVMAHFFRYIIYFFMVLIIIWYSFKFKKINVSKPQDTV
ncbi:O-antigen translocase [Lacinutrix algicola]|uniref:O-antigen translocase n=1 Tax=Lacinutrix algicola TaxID=342954 RepID=UPI0006E2F955|nr:O-antigen translocase [Lacinutrix algicola]